MADVPGTLKGYDIVFSISAEAINEQFRTLYNKALPSDRLPPPIKLRNSKVPLPRPAYFINHDFKVFPKEEEEEGDEGANEDGEEEEAEEEVDESQMQGIDGHIECPVISFHPEKRGVAIITLKFFRDETVEDPKKKDSVLRYWKVSKGRPTLKPVIVNGWSFSWEADIAQRDIDNVIEGKSLSTVIVCYLITPAEGSSQVQVPDEALDQLKNKFNTDESVDSSIFTASSIFCLLEAVQMTNTFQLKAPEGFKQPDDFEFSVVSTLVVKHFTNMRNAVQSEDGKDKSHLPTPNSPFVLGYGIRQQVPDLASINAMADPTKTPAYFLPRKVDCTTTASPGGQYTGGTLNFCMLTHREPGDEALAIPNDESDAGRFSETFFEHLQVYGGAGSSEHAGGHDGVMAFSKKIFNDYWLNRTIVSRLVPKPEEHGHLLSPTGNSVGLRRRDLSTNLNEAEHRLDYEYHTIDVPEEPTYEQKIEARGFNIVDANYSSDFLKYTPEERQATDLKRNLYIDLIVRNELKIELQTKGWNSFGQGWSFTSHKEWKQGRTAEQRSRFRLGYTISPGQGGVWSIEPDSAPERTTFPGPNVNVQTLGPYSDDYIPDEWRNWGSDWTQDGCQMLLENHHTFKVFGQAAEMEKFKNAANAWYDFHDDGIQTGMDSILGELKNAVIMPAGQIVTFSGLDSDEQGHVYSHVDYMTSNAVEQIKH